MTDKILSQFLSPLRSELLTFGNVILEHELFLLAVHPKESNRMSKRHFLDNSKDFLDEEIKFRPRACFTFENVLIDIEEIRQVKLIDSFRWL